MDLSKELRYGNIVQRPEDLRIPLLDKGHVYHSINNIMLRDCEYYKEQWAFEAIPLTYEIFEKHGFVKIPLDGNSGYSGRADLNFVYPVLYLDKHTTLNTNGGIGYLFLNGVRIPCQYFHQLQNLYFSLTGKELEVNL